MTRQRLCRSAMLRRYSKALRSGPTLKVPLTHRIHPAAALVGQESMAVALTRSTSTTSFRSVATTITPRSCAATFLPLSNGTYPKRNSRGCQSRFVEFLHSSNMNKQKLSALCLIASVWATVFMSPAVNAAPLSDLSGGQTGRIEFTSSTPTTAGH